MIVTGQCVSTDGIRQRQIRIERDRIVDVGERLGTPDVTFDTNCLIFAGMGDIHVHARDDVTEKTTHKEDFNTAAAAAINGGVVHVADMPNNPIAPVSDETYAAKQQHLNRRNVPIHVTLYAGIGPGTRALSKTVPYKAYMGPSVGDLFFKSLDSLDDTLASYRGATVAFHCEDPDLLVEHRDAATHEQRRPPECEVVATEFALKMIEKYDLSGILCHYSVARGLERIQSARQRGVRVACEATPHHLYFDITDMTDANRHLMQMNPPLRRPEDREGLLTALRDGTVDYLATDHAPHTLEEKATGVSGQPHLDTYGAFVTWLMSEKDVSPRRIAAVCSENPGEFANRFTNSKRFGRVEPGYTASLTVLNMTRPHTVRREELKTKCRWSPFEGVTFPGSVEAVFLDGQRVK